MNYLTDENLAELEQALGLRLPDDVREKYRESNGLKGPTGIQLLYTFGLDQSNDIIRVNALKEETWFPQSFKSIVLVGDDGCGSLIGYDWKKEHAILWNPADGDWIQETRNSITSIWKYIIDLYEIESRRDAGE